MILITKNIKNKKYYYLKYSFRKGSKIITKEMYLGVKIPEDIEKIKEDFIQDLKTELNKRLESIRNNFQLEWKRIPESARKKELEEISIAFTYNTNAIEGSTITLEETRELLHNKISPNKPIRDVKETEEHSEVFLKMLQKKERITNELLLEWHKDIFAQTKDDISGRFREHLVRVGSYLAPDWQDVKKMMNELVEFIGNNKNMNPVELSARLHYKFEKIHPFSDGNGRIGRLLMNYILWWDGYPMLIIEKVKRKQYYKALTKDEEGFVNYFIRKYLREHNKRIKE